MKNLDASKIVFVFICATFIFLYGFAVGHYRIFPYDILSYIENAAVQVIKESTTIAGVRPEHYLAPARYDGIGVTRLDADRAAPGLTLMTGFFADTNELRLVRLDGSIVKRWPVRFSEFFPNPEHIQPETEVPRTDWNIDIHGAVALPDGSVVFNFNYGGTVKLDRCGNVLWTLPLMTHHSVDQAADGGFWIPLRRYTDGPSGYPLIRLPYQEDFVAKISADGQLITEFSVLGLFFSNDLHAVLFANGMYYVRNLETDVVHVNDVEELRSDRAERFPEFAAGDLLLSLRKLNLVMVVDPHTQKVKWYQTGPWIRQHDPDFEADGTITVFNNNSDDTGGGRILGGSEIVRFNPNDDGMEILYGDKPDQKMFTNVYGKHQLLGNGNILITEAKAGRIFEVTAEGDIVWEFIDRFDDDEIASVSQATRYREDYFSVDDWACE